MNNMNGNTIFTPFKKFDWILNNKSESFTKKSESLVQVWSNLAQCKFENSDYHYLVQIFGWAKLHTLNIVLTGEWKKFKDSYQEVLLKEVKRTQNQLTRMNSVFFNKCQELLDVIKNPWSDPTLEYLVQTPNADIGAREIEFFCAETAYLISVRLKKLCESQCEDLALNLAKAFMKCYRLSQIEKFNLDATETQVWYIFDMYVALLYKFKENDCLLEMLKGLNPEEGLNLIQRFAKKRVTISKIWKHCHKIAVLSSQIYISSTVQRPIDEIRNVLLELIRAYVRLNNTDAYLKDVADTLRSIIRLADSAAHIYIFCDVFQEELSSKMRAFIIELYIRALTTDMNLLERQKSDADKGNLAATTERLANGFTNLAGILEGDVTVSRECTMTAFSLKPTVERLKKIEELARLSGFEVLDTGQEWKCKLHPPMLPSDDVAWKCVACGEYTCKPQLNVPLNTNTALNEAITEEKLGITRELCDDLIVLLSCPRYQVFSWLLDWPNLHRLCLMYLNNPESVKNVVTELKFLDIDYSLFATVKKEPLDEYAGIERGYEQYLDHEFNSDEEQLNEQDPNYFGEIPNDHLLPVVPLPQKSDPNTLKSLRLFRPNLKRSRGNVDINVPEKMSRNGQNDHSTPSCSSSRQTDYPFGPIRFSSQNTFRSFSNIYQNQTTSQYVHNSGISQTCNNDINGKNVPYFHNDGILTYNNGNSTFFANNFTSNIRTTTDPTRTHVNHFDSTYYKMYPGKNSINYSNATAATQFNNYSTSNTTNFQTFGDANSYPKNGQVATLQRVGGQVAMENDRSPNSNLVHGNPNNKTKWNGKDTYENNTICSHNYSKTSDVARIKTPAIASNIKTKETKTENSTYPDDSNDVENKPPIENVSNDKRDENDNSRLFDEIKQIKLQIRIPKLEMNSTTIKVEDLKKYECSNAIKAQNEFKFVKNNDYVDNSLSESEYDYFSSTNPLKKVLDTLKNAPKSLNMKDKETFIQNNYFENRVETVKSKRKKFKNIKRPYSPDEIKYESYPDTGSDGQIEQDSDDQYNRCYINLFKNNLLYDASKGVCKNVENLLKNNGSMKIDETRANSKCGKKIKRTISRKIKKSRNINRSTDDSVKPKTDVDVTTKNVRVILDRLPMKIFENHMKNLENARKNEENPKISNEQSNITEQNKSNFDEIKLKDAKVVLQRLSVTNNSYVRSVLANIPGLHDTHLLRPAETEVVVNVVQIAGGRNNTSVPVANSQTSTQVTPHIQRIGQPRVEKTQNDQSDSTENTTATTTTVGNVKPTTSQPSTLINILSQQVIRPGQSSNNCVRTKPSPLINIVSHQIIRPSTQVVQKMIANSAQTTDQVTDTSKIETTQEQTVPTVVKNVVKTATPGGGSTTPAPGTILQFICKSTSLPKFQQAFGKTVYQANNIETSDATSTVENVTSSDVKKTPIVKSPLNIQPLQGSVIYTRQVPVGQTINLIQPGRQVFRIATSNPDQISLVKDTVIHSKMSALLTAALQGKKAADVESDVGNDNVERVTLTRPTLVQNARIVKPVIQIPSNVIRTSTNTQSNLSSTTLEQLREFDMVYKQIKERSNTGSTPSESSTQSESETSPQGISVTYLTQGQKFAQLSPVVVVSSYCNLQPAASPALSVTSQGSSSPCVTPASTPTLPKVSSKTSSKGKSLKNTSTHASKASPIPKPQQKPQEDEHTTQRIFDILAEYAEQLRNSPDLNNKPAPRRRSNPPTNPNHNSKRKKSSSSKKPTVIGSAISESDLDDQRTIGSEDSSCGVVQLSIKDDEQAQNQTTESSDTTRPLILTENSTTRNLIIADSSVGEALKLQNTAVLVPGNYIMPVSMVKGGQQIAVVSGGSKILATVPARSGQNMLLLQSFLNQNRKPGVSAVKYSTLQPISGISSQTVAASVSGQSPIILPQNAHNLTAVSLGQSLTLKKVDDSDNRGNTELLLAIAQPRDNANTAESSSHPDSSSSSSSSNSSSNVQNSSHSIKFDESNVQTNNSTQKVYTYQKATTTPIATPVISQSIRNGSDKSTSPSQPNIITLNISSDSSNKDDASKTTKRVQSVLVTTCTSTNGPMFSHTPPRYRKPSEMITVNSEVGTKGTFLQSREKQQKDETKQFQTATVYMPNKNKKVANANSARLDREIQQLCLQRKQAALERELRLQKSLSEECEDLGVDEPSTSDLFPEADLLFDSNHSPSFDQTTHDIVGKKIIHQDIKDKSITLFSDDDNSGSLRTDFLFDAIQYQPTEAELQYEQSSRQLTNGQSGCTTSSNESGSSCEDNTLLQNCASMSDVTLNSPISPEFADNPTHTNKYKFKYSNRKKTERHKNDTWTSSTTGGEVSSSEDTMMCGSEMMGKVTNSPKGCVIKRESHASSSCDEDEEFKVVRVAISKTDLAKDEESCDESHYDDDLDSQSGRGARRSVKKMCSCCNGTQEGNRKRPSSRPHTPALHKRAFLNKKR